MILKVKTKNIIFLLIYSLISTALSSAILFLINNTIYKTQPFTVNNVAIIFFIIVISSYFLNVFFQKKMIDISYNFLYSHELKVFKVLRKISFQNFEKVNTERIYGIIEDLRLFVFLPGTITNTINSILMIFICFCYLLFVSTKSAFIVFFIIFIIIYIYFSVNKILANKVNQLRTYNDFYYKYVDDAIKGFKELKVSSVKELNLYHKFLFPNRENAKKLDINISNSFLTINLMSQSGLYLIFGIILFLLPLTGLLDKEQAISFIVILLFLSGPINSLIAMQSYYTRIFVANKRIKKFFEDFSYSEIKKPIAKYPDIKFKSILFKDIQFKYNNDSFRLGPVNLEIERGDIVFIIGKNGSGKSTFINILTGLYEPDEGEILLNGNQIDNTDISYKNLISAIFTDNYLFSQNYDDYSLENNEIYKELLEVMKLDKVITDDKDASARRTFSKGQGKRMSMIFALMENHPILVLDEWAADQDPYFRKYFYENLIPKFKKNGKTVIAVTHDDMYFEYADKVIKFEYGNIVPEIKIETLVQEQ